MNENDRLLLQLSLVPPRANMNGTSREELLSQYSKALEALLAAQTALSNMAPHGRDYLTLADGQYAIAREQHRIRQGLLAGVLAEVSILAEEFATVHPVKGA